MPIFTYSARDLQGQDFNGDIESGDYHGAVAILRRRGLIVISVKPKSAPPFEFLDKFFHRVKFNDIVTFTRQLATMVEAGLVLSEAIDILAEQQSNQRFKIALVEVSQDLKGGLSLAGSLGKHSEIFSPLYVNLVRSGESSGKLDEVMLKMAQSLEKEREFKERIKGAMIYPAVVIVLMIGVIILMMAFVIPRLSVFYTQSSLELPLPTKILIGVSSVFTSFWWILVSLILISGVAFTRFAKTVSGKLSIDRFILKIPYIGKMSSYIILTNFTRTFGLLTAASIPLLESITIVEGVTGNAVYKEGLRTTYIGVESGLTLSQQLLVLPYFPRLIGQMVRVGEETGKMDEVFIKLAEYFETESDQMIKNLTVAIEPIVLIVLGIGVGFLAISVMLPIYKLTTSF